MTVSIEYNFCIGNEKAESGKRSLTKSTVIAGEFAGWTGAIKLDTTDATHLILRDIPMPSSNGIPFFDSNLHGEE